MNKLGRRGQIYFVSSLQRKDQLGMTSGKKIVNVLLYKACPKRVFQLAAALPLGLMLVVVPPQVRSEPPKHVALPTIPVAGCRGERAKLYDECNSQVEIFAKAFELATSENKVLLVSYGAEWCVWCHAFDAYISGEHTKFETTYGGRSSVWMHTVTTYEKPLDDPSEAAMDLANFVAANFVVVHIENRYAPDGIDVLRLTGAYDHHSGGIPFIFTVNETGLYSAEFEWNKWFKPIEQRRDEDDGWFRGFQRHRLKAELNRMMVAASK